MKYSHKHHHICDDDDMYIFINSKEILTIKNIEKMANLTIDIEDNQADLTTHTTAVQTAFTALQTGTLADLSTNLANLETAINALASFQITFTASVPPAA